MSETRHEKLLALVGEWQEARKPAGLSEPGVDLVPTYQAAVKRMAAADEALAAYDLDGPADGARDGEGRMESSQSIGTDQSHLARAIRLAKEATNGWACYAKRKIELDEIARLHREIDALAALRAGAEALRGHDPLTGLPPDGPKCRRHGIYKLAVAHYYCEACAKEGRATVGPASAAAEPEPRA